MKVENICVGQPLEMQYLGESITTSIFKKPVSGPVRVSLENIEGDRQSDLRFHGGRDKAMYIYPSEHYSYWQNKYGNHLVEPAQFGENLTISGAMEQDVVIGTRFGLGSVTVVVTQPRVPCYKLGIRTGDPEMVRRFWNSGRLGWYLRVDSTGSFDRGDRFDLIDQPAHGITVHDLWNTVITRDRDTAADMLAQLKHLDSGWIKRLQILTKS